ILGDKIQNREVIGMMADAREAKAQQQQPETYAMAPEQESTSVQSALSSAEWSPGITAEGNIPIIRSPMPEGVSQEEMKEALVGRGIPEGSIRFVNSSQLGGASVRIAGEEGVQALYSMVEDRDLGSISHDKAVDGIKASLGKSEWLEATTQGGDPIMRTEIPEGKDPQ